ncbi:hypothetical protein [Roseicella aerolata]|uniref:Uncharacterized protein n=1 Tax=Roseicella aerolata TaxID=2883479 RepID=A0A9X1IDZ1_9PROT|nr:hypothetical protein [Roseicella aerolata]MCB4822949.1 hypothetical protein [Roseicella aerolata]
MRRRHAVLALGLLLSAPAGAASPEADSLRALAGGTMVQLAGHPVVSLPLRGAVRGRQQMVYEGLRLPGPPLLLHEGRWLVGWGCADPEPRQGCADRGLFLAFDAEGERLFLLLLENGAPIHLAPPRAGRWPGALAGPFSIFAPGLARGPVFDPD